MCVKLLNVACQWKSFSSIERIINPYYMVEKTFKSIAASTQVSCQLIAFQCIVCKIIMLMSSCTLK